MLLTPALKRFIPPIISLALFMEAIDVTIINTAIPSMAESLQVNPIDLKIALISYLLSLAIFIPISGWLADKFGMKKVFVIALGLFTLSSAACGFAHQLGVLVVARIFQGLGGSLMMPIGRLMIVRWFDREELIQVMNRVVLLALIGPALGPFIGGCITETFSWRWIFWVNIPFGVLNMYLAQRFLPEYQAEKVNKFDAIGFILFGLGLAGLTFGLSVLSEEALSLSTAMGIIIASLSLLVIYSLHAKRQAFPVLNTALFRWRTFRLSIIGNIVTRIGFNGLPFLLPLLLQIPLGYSPTVSGAMTAVFAIGAMFVKSFSKRLLNYTGFKPLLIINTVLLGLSLVLFSSVTAETSKIIIVIYVFIGGFLMSLQYSAMNPLAFADIKPIELSSATSIHSVTIQISQSFSVALCALALTQFSARSEGHLLSLADFHHTFLIMSIFTVVSSMVFLFLKKEDGYNLITRRNNDA